MHYDLIIIGMGLSGLMAAKTASEAGQKVLIVGKGMGGLTLFSNTIDLLGNLPTTINWRDGLFQWIQDHPEHPYGKIGLEKIEKALSSFNALFPPPYTFQAKNETNSFIPTGAGTFRPTFLIPSTMMRGIGFMEKKSLIVGFKGFKDFYSQQLADRYQCRGVTLSLPEPSPTEWTGAALARKFEQKAFREFIGMELKKQISNEELVGFPALLGIKDPTGVKKDLEKKIGVSLFEIPVLPPSIPGMRIFNRFKERFLQKGVTILQGHSVTRVHLRGRWCEEVEISHPPLTTSYSADRFILSTGRFISGGLQAHRQKILEPLFHLPIHPSGLQDNWFGKTFFDEHPIHRMGIVTDLFLRPVDDKGILLFENVWVAGTILAYQNWISEKSREGIEIVTGYWATKYALSG